MALVMNPAVLKKAQAELDGVTGGERLPAFDDRPKLPYIEALMLEVLRWNCVTTGAGQTRLHNKSTCFLLIGFVTGLAHMASQDDTHNGYTIPKGTLIFANHWLATYSSFRTDPH